MGQTGGGAVRDERQVAGSVGPVACRFSSDPEIRAIAVEVAVLERDLVELKARAQVILGWVQSYRSSLPDPLCAYKKEATA